MNAAIVSDHPRTSVEMATETLTLSDVFLVIVGCAWFRALPRGVFFQFMRKISDLRVGISA